MSSVCMLLGNGHQNPFRRQPYYDNTGHLSIKCSFSELSFAPLVDKYITGFHLSRGSTAISSCVKLVSSRRLLWSYPFPATTTATTGLQADDQPSTSDMFNTMEKTFGTCMSCEWIVRGGMSLPRDKLYKTTCKYNQEMMTLYRFVNHS